jgi:hypothetical protein
MRVNPSYVGVAILAFAVEPAQSAQSYDVTALPFTPASLALNDAGVVAGGIAEPGGSVSLAEWSQGVLTNLGAPTGLPGGLDIMQPFGINNGGEIVGTIHGAQGGAPSVSFIYGQGGFTVLPLVNSTDIGAVATGINNGGQVVGYDVMSPSNGGLQPWLWYKDAYSSVPVAASYATALGINASGTIIGNRLVDGQSGERGYISGGGTTEYLTVGALNAINDAGVAVGVSSSTGTQPQTATVFKNGIATSILSVDSSAFGINSAGDVVGFYQPNGVNGPRVFLWDPHMGALDLTPGGYLFAAPLAINSSGEIVGYGQTTAGVYQDFLLTPDPHGVLTPKPIVPTGVPEPGASVLFSLGLAMLFVLRGRPRLRQGLL